MINIKDVLPHREPFLFVDEIVSCKYQEYAKGYRRIKADETWIPGHFPDNPILPGVLLLESMAQVGGFVFANEEGRSDKIAFLSKVDNLKYIRRVLVGDTVEIEAAFINSFMNYAEVFVKSFVNGKKVASCNIVYTFLDKL